MPDLQNLVMERRRRVSMNSNRVSYLSILSLELNLTEFVVAPTRSRLISEMGSHCLSPMCQFWAVETNVLVVIYGKLE